MKASRIVNRPNAKAEEKERMTFENEIFLLQIYFEIVACDSSDNGRFGNTRL
jgi:hypothetical protein